MKLEPVIPFEPKNTDHIQKGDQWISQVKWDGVRILTYFDGSKGKLFNRKLNERTMQFEEYSNVKQYCSASSVIFDGEIIALQNGKPSFHEVMKRDGVRKAESISRAKGQTPVIYMIFDVLFYNGKWITNHPLHQRQEILNNIIIPQDNLQVVQSFQDGEGLFKAIKEQGMEGIVCKDLEQPYLINGKDRRWQKIKNYQDLIAVVGGVTYRQGTVNAILLGLFDEEGQLWYIGHAGTGKLTSEDWRSLTARVEPMKINQMPFVNKPDRYKEATWIKPILTVKIEFMNWTENKTLRQPSIQAFVDVTREECTFKQT
jgi:bifunctional non-homologous end joining protein LigD